MENRMDELFFKELAQAYAEHEGEVLINELAELDRASALPQSFGLTKKIKSKVFKHKFTAFSRVALPLAASFVVALLLYANYGGFGSLAPSDSAPTTSAPLYLAEAPTMESAFYTLDEKIIQTLEHSVALVSASLPTGYSVTGVDYDNASAIMEINAGQSNRIVIVTEAYHEFNTEGFSKLTIGDSLAYGLVKSDYCLLKYAKDDMLYTLSGLYEYGDLIEIIENI